MAEKMTALAQLKTAMAFESKQAPVIKLRLMPMNTEAERTQAFVLWRCSW